MAADSRGAWRGRCTLCRCEQYTRQESDKCAGCSHPPTKHVKLDRSQMVHGNETTPPLLWVNLLVLASARFFRLGQSGGVSVHQHVFKPSHQPLPAPSPVPAYVPPAVHHSANSGPFLKKCAADWCSNKAHYDHELGPFDYCTPQCRDRHLLPQERMKLREEISENTAKMMISNLPPSPHTVLGTANSPTCSNRVPSSDSVAVPLADESK